MKASVRQKAIRHLASALLSGVFTDREIDEISRALIHRDEFTVELGFVTKDMNHQLASRARAARPEMFDEQANHNSPPAKAARLMRDAGITQLDLLDIIWEIAPEVAESLKRKRWPTIRMLELFFRSQSRDKHAKLFKELAKRAPASVNTDPYLDLITDRLKG
jgi:hypothetical protein